MEILIAIINIFITMYISFVVVKYVFYKECIIEVKSALNSLEWVNKRIIHPSEWDRSRKNILLACCKLIYYGHNKTGEKLLNCLQNIPSCEMHIEDELGNLNLAYKTKLSDTSINTIEECQNELNRIRPNIKSLLKCYF